jgi:hypothetical protein
MVNFKQEKFSQLVASGSNYTAAYLEIYNPKSQADANINPRASRLANKMKARIQELKADLAVDSSWTRQRLLGEVQRVHQRATDRGQHATALKSLELIGKITGLLVDRSEVKIEQTHYAALSWDQLERLASLADSPLRITSAGVVESVIKVDYDN